MKTERAIRKKIVDIKRVCKNTLTGSLATIQCNAPRALMQLATEENLKALHWVLGEEYKSSLKGTN